MMRSTRKLPVERPRFRRHVVEKRRLLYRGVGTCHARCAGRARGATCLFDPLPAPDPIDLMTDVNQTDSSSFVRGSVHGRSSLHLTALPGDITVASPRNFALSTFVHSCRVSSGKPRCAQSATIGVPIQASPHAESSPGDVNPLSWMDNDVDGIRQSNLSLHFCS